MVNLVDLNAHLAHVIIIRSLIWSSNNVLINYNIFNPLSEMVRRRTAGLQMICVEISMRAAVRAGWITRPAEYLKLLEIPPQPVTLPVPLIKGIVHSKKTEETRGTCDNVSILTLYWKINNDNEQWQTRQILQMHFISWLVTGFWLRPFNVQASTLCLRFQNNIWREGACREPAFLSSLCARLCEC